MKVAQVKEIAMERGVKAGKLNKSDLIRAIQQAEGNQPCFEARKAECGQKDCLWYEDCT